LSSRDPEPFVQPPDEVFDITIIGAGPTGLFAAFYAGLRGLRTKVLEALPEPGGQLAVLYPEKYIYDAPGHPKVLAKDLVKLLMEQAAMFDPTYVFGERAIGLRHRASRLIELQTDGRKHYTKTVLLSAGVGAFAPNKLELESARRLEGKGVFYFVRDKSYFRDKRVLIVGGGDSAVDWALNLKELAKKVTLIHRRDQFRAHEMSIKQLFDSDVAVGLFYELKDVHGTTQVEGATVFNNRTKEELRLPADAVLINIGFKADLGPIKEWGLETDRRAVIVNGNMETNLPGVYAAGDIAQPTTSVKLNLIATGYAQATIAVNVAKTYIDPKADVFPGHSSEMQLAAAPVPTRWVSKF
jgi:thioredoxin reductase (NADPH)